MEKNCDVINREQNKLPESLFVAGNFNHSNLETVLLPTSSLSVSWFTSCNFTVLQVFILCELYMLCSLTTYLLTLRSARVKPCSPSHTQHLRHLNVSSY